MELLSAAMGSFDWWTLVLAALMVALAILGELKDIKLVTAAMNQAGDRLGQGWRIALTTLNAVRRHVFLPSVLMNVSNLVLHKGGDSLSVCLNTIAILFLCEVDNISCFRSVCRSASVLEWKRRVEWSWPRHKQSGWRKRSSCTAASSSLMC